MEEKYGSLKSQMRTTTDVHTTTEGEGRLFQEVTPKLDEVDQLAKKYERTLGKLEQVQLRNEFRATLFNR